MRVQSVSRYSDLFSGIALVLLVCFSLAAGSITSAATAHAQASSLSKTDKEIADESAITARVAGLSDEEARKLLITELAKSAQPIGGSASGQQAPGSPLASLLNTLSSKSDMSEQGTRQLVDSLPGFLPDLYQIFLKLCPYGTSHGAVENILLVLFYLTVGLVLEMLFRRLVLQKLFISVTANGMPEIMGGIDRFMASLVREIPSILGILIFFCGAYLIYFAFIWTDSPHIQLFFLALLISITCIRLIAVLSRMLFAPRFATFRLIPLDNAMAITSHNALIRTFGYILVAMMFGVVLQKLGAQEFTVKIYFLLAATLLLGGTSIAALLYKKRVSDAIVNAPNEYGGEVSWGRKQFAAIWHLLAIAYLIVLWMLVFNDLIDPDTKRRGAFILSFFVVPIWMVSDKMLQWLVKYAMATLKIHQEKYDDTEEITEAELLQREKGKRTFLKVMNIARMVLIALLLIWIAGLWDIYIPIFSNLSGVLFDTLLILTVAIFFWQFISSWIEAKIQEAIPAEPEDKDKEDDEWGAAANRGRSYTLLPMLRKFIGTILVTMVTMTILSSMGVDIGPLLAGAGVVGLAVGFGAQKLVADMFSGFFYLLDDAFRVGEYIEAGGITGTVENISLRNVMLRHHRGMLQIVPHSELGAITNYMRGGIIVKFNLDFPYDADIDQIRKVIKKVGQGMLAEEEFSKDFIRPVKSQGVREITNSVMTIRVKFTAKPGAHFLIRREAYKRITEALRAKGIHYAHKKVIVDIPPQQGGITEEQLAQAAGAATREMIDQEEQKAAEAAAGRK